MPSNWTPSAEHVARLKGRLGDGNVMIADSEESAITLAPKAKFIFGHRYIRQSLPLAPNLQWIQSSASGVDQLPYETILQRRIRLTRNPLNARSIALHALALLLALTRRLPESVDSQRLHAWEQHLPLPRFPKSALVLGLGGIGMELVPLLRALAIEVTGSSRRGTAEQRGVCDRFVPAMQWREALGTCDALFLALPLDPSTRGILGEIELQRLRPDAFLINVARSGLVDLITLQRMLRAQQLAGAAFDVMDVPPAPMDPIWDTPRLLITPKIAAHNPQMQEAFEHFAEEQLDRFLSGLPLKAEFAP